MVRRSVYNFISMQIIRTQKLELKIQVYPTAYSTSETLNLRHYWLRQFMVGRSFVLSKGRGHLKMYSTLNKHCIMPKFAPKWSIKF